MNRRALLSASAALIVPKVWAQPVPRGGPAGYQELGPGPLYAGIFGTPPTLDLNLLTATLDASITWTRSTTATDGLYTDAAGSGYNTLAINAPRISVANGLLIENSKTNSLIASDTPTTRTTGSLSNSVYCLSVIGSGTATSSAGTAVGSGFGVASAGVPNVFTVTTPGTVVVTVAGSLTRFQIENNSYPTSYIPTVAAPVARSADSGTLPTAAWFNANEGTYVVDFMQRQIAAGALEFPSLYTDVNNVISLRITSAAVAALAFVANVNSGGPTATGAVTANIPQKVGFTYAAATKVLSISLNGGPVVFATAANLPTVNQIKFGTARVAPQDGTTRRIRYYPRALPVPEFRAVTAL